MANQEYFQVSMRMPVELVERVREIAEAERRSMTGQIIVIVEDWLADQAEQAAETEAAQ